MIERFALAHALGLALAASRVAGFLVASPWPGERVPAQARVGLLVVLSFLIASSTEPPRGLPELGLGLVPVATVEFAIGVLIGLVFRLVMAAAEVLGGMLSQASGLGTPALFDPALGAQDTALSQAVTAFSLLLALASGVHRVVLAYLLESFRALPVGVPVDLGASAALVITLGGDAVAVGLRLAMPVAALSVTTQIVLALIARAAPSLQIFSVGFTVLLAVGLSAIATSLGSIGSGLMEHQASARPALEKLLTDLPAR